MTQPISSKPSSNSPHNSQSESNGKQSFQISAPSISLPKGGGAIRGIGEKFAANPVTGTGSMTVPIATSPGRSGFGPQLSLLYDSGAGNGPFGFGWSLSLPSITRKTDKGIPKYQDAVDSDVFILSGAEDLVPEFEKDTAEQWVIKDNKHVVYDKPRTVNGVKYDVRRYRPRIEGLFARIERWTNQSDPTAVFWRSISKDNITTWYGKDENSRVFDPNDKSRIFSWLICQSYDDKGNVIVYNYKAENSDNVDVSQAHERNRTDIPNDAAKSNRTANRYLKRICYGNREPYLPKLTLTTWSQPPDPTAVINPPNYFFEVVFDYEDGHYTENAPDTEGRVFAHSDYSPPPTAKWSARVDPFSTYRAGFEVRTYRLCQRVLMFHHFPDELGTPDYLVRSTDLTYSYEDNPTDVRNPIYSFLDSMSQSGYVRQPNGSYLKKSLPPLQFEYTKPEVQAEVRDVDPQSLENLPYGLDGSKYQWVDLDGEGLSGIFTEQGDVWFYKRNVSPLPIKTNDKEEVSAHFAPLELVAKRPSLAALSGGGQQFLDLAGDGQLDLVALSGPTPGFFERMQDEGWESFKPFRSLPNVEWNNPNLKFVDLTGDGHADILITEDDVFWWYPSLAEDGFGPAERVPQNWDEEKGPRLVFADLAHTIHLADLSGDGLSDLVRIRNGEVCYWPNLGYGRFGAKVTMDSSPWFDNPDQFDPRRIQLADIDGSGTTDIIYLGPNSVNLYFNQSGNSWSKAHHLDQYPQTDSLSSVTAMDLLGNGTACLLWSSPLPGNARRPMRYINLMGERKPHLLVKTINNLGAETHVVYTPSTKFYLEDKRDGKPWITKLPFPVHVVERVETFDRISRNWFVTRYQYHHGYFDGTEREFRGFGMVEQFDTEAFDTLQQGSTVRLGERADTNIDPASHSPPIHTKTWFHTGAFFEDYRISQHFFHEYYGRPKETDIDFDAKLKELESTLLDDTILPPNLTAEQEREACRALKGALLRQEVYALDGTDKAQHPYTVTEQNFTIQCLQPRSGNRHRVFFTHAREAINYHYERNPADPRVSHAMTLKVDAFGNVERSIAIGYPRADVPERRVQQNETHLTLTLQQVANRNDQADWYRVGLPVESRTYEVVKPPTATQRFTWKDLSDLVTALVPLDQHEPPPAKTIPYEQWDWRKQWNPQTEPGGLANTRLRLIEHVRTLYRKDNLTTLLALGAVESLALPGESYKLAFTPGLLNVYAAKIAAADLQLLLKDEGKYIELDNDGHWWIPSGRMFFLPAIPNPQKTEPTVAEAAQELAEAQQHFFLPRRYRDPFWNNAIVDYDGPADLTLPRYDLLVTRMQDPVQNVVRVENSYRELQAWRMTDPNGNRAEVAFDTLGMVVSTAVKGKDDTVGDTLSGFAPDLTQDQIDGFYDVADPHVPAPSRLKGATTRIIYDLDCFRRTQKAHPEDPTQWLPVYAATLARETHVSDPLPSQGLKIQISFSYSDGFGREIQKKIQAEPGPLVEGGPVVRPRWVGSGWTIFNNKGKPVRQYEPFFSQLPEKRHRFEFGVRVGVSPILFYDPAERVVATLHPNHTYEKVVFDPWQQTSFDVNDTLKFDPKTDDDVRGFFTRLADADYLPTWFARMSSSANTHDNHAAQRTESHADTPTKAHFDALGRPFLTIADNGALGKYETRIDLDIEGNQRAIIDTKNRIVMRYEYDLVGNRIKQASMDAGARWMLANLAGKPIRAWDDRNFTRRITYDAIQRPNGLYVTEPAGERLAEQTIYGEDKPSPTVTNHRGRVWQVRDDAGIATSEAYDFKGNLVSGRRDLRTEYKTPVSWAPQPAPAISETFTSSSKFDALGRVVESVAPDGSVTWPRYNEGNLLEAVDVRLRGAAQFTPFVRNIDYDAKGQRTRIEYNKNDTPIITDYSYDPDTFRLTHLITTRPNHPDVNKRTLQDLRYGYDPAGNIIHILDDAQPRVFFDNACIDASNNYRYDALYRLVAASGREHKGQDLQPNWDDSPRTGNPIPYNCAEMRPYVETYRYDEVGNILQMVHHTGANMDSPGVVVWNRRYQHRTGNNILRCTSMPGEAMLPDYADDPAAQYGERYVHDAHGNMTAMTHLPTMRWNFEDQLTEVDLQGGGTAYYVYDAAGHRVRKVVERNGATVEERIYLSGYEVYRKRQGGVLQLERQTLHVMDDQQRIALVETRTQGNDPAPGQLIRYHIGNHLSSVTLELDPQAQIISYEEYFPYGGTSYQAVGSQTETPKRYRYTGKERDEESGLYYHGARYYAPWLARWLSPDPKGILDGVNLYRYCRGNPVRFTDPTGTETQPLKKRVDEGLKKDLNLGADRSLGPRSQTKPNVDVLTSQARNAAQQPPEPVDKPCMVNPRPVPPATAIKQVPATSDMPSVDKRVPSPRYPDFPKPSDPTQQQEDPAQKDPSLALKPKPEAEATGDPKNYRAGDPKETTKKAGATDVLEHKPVSEHTDKLSDAAGDHAEKALKKSSTGEKALAIGGAAVVVGGGVAGVATSKEGSNEALEAQPKVVIKITKNVKVKVQIFGNPLPPQPANPPSGPRNANPMPRHWGPSTPPAAGETPKIGDNPPILNEPPGMTGHGRGFVITGEIKF